MRPRRFIAAPALTVLLVAARLLVLSAAAQKEEEVRNPPLGPAEALAEGHALIADLLTRKPAENSTNIGTIRVRDGQGHTLVTRAKFLVFSTPTNWVSVYETEPVDHPGTGERLTVVHLGGGANHYTLTRLNAGADPVSQALSGDALFAPFAGSDFWFIDLGLEFLRWPDPRVLRKEMRKGMPTEVLQVRNPHPVPGSYSRVVAWVDRDNSAILHAEAYDAHGDLLKVFDPTGVKKHELEEMEMRTVSGDFRSEPHTWIKFDL